MFHPSFLYRKFCLAGLAAKLASSGRVGAAMAILRDRRHGYECLDWAARLPGSFGTIIDAGAHTGSASAAFDLLFRPNRLLAIEPNPALAAALRHRFAARPQIQVAAVALAETEGTLPFYLQDFDAASSLYPLRDGYLASLGLPDKCTRIDVPTRRLDQLAANAGFTEVDLLKLDCQGAELRILHGARDLLPHIRYIYTEVSFEPIYPQGALFHEIHTMLRDAGFRLAHLGASPNLVGGIDQGDALYHRPER